MARESTDEMTRSCMQWSMDGLIIAWKLADVDRLESGFLHWKSSMEGRVNGMIAELTEHGCSVDGCMHTPEWIDTNLIAKARRTVSC